MYSFKENNMNYIDEVINTLEQLMNAQIQAREALEELGKIAGLTEGFTPKNVWTSIHDIRENIGFTTHEQQSLELAEEKLELAYDMRSIAKFELFQFEEYFGNDDSALKQWFSHKSRSCTCQHPMLWSTVLKCIDFAMHIDAEGDITGYYLECTECANVSVWEYIPDGLIMYDIEVPKPPTEEEPF
jgi:hypothetical protein